MEFLREVERYNGCPSIIYPPGSVGAICERYEQSEDFKKLAESSRKNYMVHIKRFKELWGKLPAAKVLPEHVLAFRDRLAKQTPVMANHMLAFGRVLWGWALPLQMVSANPFEAVNNLEVSDRGHIPWPKWVAEYVRDHAPPDLVRLMRFGIMTCQRGSDLVRLGPLQRDGRGIWVRPIKTKRKRKRAFRVPLTPEDNKLLDLWTETPIEFTNSRWKAPIKRHRNDLFLCGPRGEPYTTSSLRMRWNRWLDTDEGKALCKVWQEWVAKQVQKFEWDIDPEEDAANPTIHGLRGTGILARRLAGHDVDQIANDIGMSRPIVEHYMRFRDQVEVAEAGRARLALVNVERA
jgi:integrase